MNSRCLTIYLIYLQCVFCLQKPQQQMSQPNAEHLTAAPTPAWRCHPDLLLASTWNRIRGPKATVPLFHPFDPQVGSKPRCYFQTT